MWAPRPSRSSVGAEQRRGGRNAAPRRAEPGWGRGPTCVGATAFTLLGWCRAAEGRARRRSPQGRARLGPGSRVCGHHGHHATRLAPSSGGEGVTPLSAGPSPARAEAPRMWVPRPSRYSVSAEQRRGGRNAAPRRAEHGSGRGPACVGATAVTLLGWCQAAEERQGPHECGAHTRLAPTRLAPTSGGRTGGATPLPAGRSPGRVGAPRAWVLPCAQAIPGMAWRHSHCPLVSEQGC